MVNPKAPCFIKDEEGKFIYLILPVNFNAANAQTKVCGQSKKAWESE